MVLEVKRAERTVEVCLDGSLVAEFEATNEAYKVAVKEAGASSDKRLNSPVAKRVKDLEDRARELSAAQRAETVVFRLRALPRLVWDGLVQDHPARPVPKGDEAGPDGYLPFNRHTIPDAALATEGAIVGVTRLDGGAVEPFTHEDWAGFSETLSESQHEDFRIAVIALNVGSNEVPFFPASDKTPSSVKK